VEIIDALLDTLKPNDCEVREAWSCAFWTAVTSRHTGLSTTYRAPELEHGKEPFTVRNAGSLVGMSACELAGYAKSERPIEASIGIATINSLLDIDTSACVEMNAADVIAEKGENGNVAIVGSFPFAKRLRETAKNVWVLEMREREDTLPAEKAPEILPQCDVVCITGTSLINHTLDDLLGYCRDRFVVLCGPSSPLSPVLFDFGIDVICGSRVTNAEEVVRHISQGACFKQVKGHGVELLAMSGSKTG